jgi:hypothetical protein
MLALKIAVIDNRIDNAKSAVELQRLASARRSLFEQWCVLAGIPKRPAKGHPPPMPKVEPIAPIGHEGNPALNQAA